MSAACNTGYENKPSFSLDLLLALNGDASGANCSLLYDRVSPQVPNSRKGLKVTFQPSIESYEIDIPLKRYSLESTLIPHAPEPVDDHEQEVPALT
jgi:hypothetical protein